VYSPSKRKRSLGRVSQPAEGGVRSAEKRGRGLTGLKACLLGRKAFRDREELQQWQMKRIRGIKPRDTRENRGKRRSRSNVGGVGF